MPPTVVIVLLVVVGAVLWVINTYFPMKKPVKAIFNIVVVVVLCVWLLQTFGVLNSIKGVGVR